MPPTEFELTCRDFERRVLTAVEEHASVDQPALRSHAAVCEECGLLWEQANLLEHALPLWNSGLPHVDLADAVLSRLDPVGPHGNLPRPRSQGQVRERPELASVRAVPAGPRRPMTNLSHVAAVAVVAVGLAMLVWPLARTAPRLESRATVDVAPSPSPFPVPSAKDVPLLESMAGGAVDQRTPEAVASEAALSLEGLLRDAGDAWGSLARETRNALWQARLLVPSPGLMLAEVLPEDLAPAESDRWSNELEREFQPIRHDLQETIEFILDSIAQELPTT